MDELMVTVIDMGGTTLAVRLQVRALLAEHGEAVYESSTVWTEAFKEPTNQYIGRSNSKWMGIGSHHKDESIHATEFLRRFGKFKLGEIYG